MKKETTLDTNEIQKLLAHRYPFMFVDRVINYEQGKSLEAIKNLTFNEAFFQGHFPEKPIMPGVLMIEALAQAAALYLFLNPKNQGKHYFLAGVDSTRFRKFAGPGDQLVLQVEWQKNKRSLHWFNGRILVENTKIMDTSIMVVEHQLTLDPSS